MPSVQDLPLPSDKEALHAFKLVTKLEAIRPSLEPCHAFAECIKIAPKLKKDQIIIVTIIVVRRQKIKIFFFERIRVLPVMNNLIN